MPASFDAIARLEAQRRPVVIDCDLPDRFQSEFLERVPEIVAAEIRPMVRCALLGVSDPNEASRIRRLFQDRNGLLQLGPVVGKEQDERVGATGRILRQRLAFRQ